jgi:DNA repair exonuclease SbcCD nuclease subunit
MLKIVVGDPHAQSSNLEEMNLLMDRIDQEAASSDVDSVIFLGDLFDTHNVLRLEVVNFWQKRLEQLAKIKKVIVLVGNHDQKNNESDEWVLSSLCVVENIHNLTVINKPTVIDGWAYIPHTSSNDKFVKTANELLSQSSVLVCHQTFNGSQYDNGFFAPNGIEPESVSGYKKVIAGHIHKFQEFSNITYVGSPRWMSISDANQDKGIWKTDGTAFHMISSGDVLPRVVQIDLAEGEDLNCELSKKDKNYIVLTGTSSWIGKTAKKYKDLARIIPKPTDTKVRNQSERSKITVFETYLKSFITEKNKKLDFDDVLGYINKL